MEKEGERKTEGKKKEEKKKRGREEGGTRKEGRKARRKEGTSLWSWWHIPVIPTLARLKQEDLKFKTILGKLIKPCLKRKLKGG